MPVFVKAAHGGGGRGMRLVTDLGRPRGGGRRRAPRGRERVRQPRRLPRAGDGAPAAHRGAGARRRARRARAPVRARLLGAAPPPEGRRDRPRAEPRSRAARPHLRRRGAASPATSATSTRARSSSSSTTRTGEHVFIEMNPRIQVEHTVTEETTDVDLVRTQLLVAEGARLHELGLRQEDIRQRGFALQCRITTEDPSAGFRPDTGTIAAYRAPGGAGVRLDEGSAYVGAEISPYFDPLLLKLTTRGPDMQTAIARARRAVEEVRIRGVTTNQAFLGKLLDDPDFRAGRPAHDVHRRAPAAHRRRRPAATARRGILRLLAERTVNRPYRQCARRPGPAHEAAPRCPRASRPPARASACTELGPRGLRSLAALARRAAAHGHDAARRAPVAVRDAHAHARHGGRSRRTWHGCSAGCSRWRSWGGATFDVALRFLNEDPWERIAPAARAHPERLPADAPAGPQPARLRALSGRGGPRVRLRGRRCRRRHLPHLRRAEQRRADARGDQRDRRGGRGRRGRHLLHRRPPRPGRAALHARPLPATSPSSSSRRACTSSPSRTWPACCARRPRPISSPALRREFDLPVHLHTHDTAGGQLATYLAAIEAGVDAVDGAAASMAGMTSQPSLASIVAATDHTARATGISLESLLELEPYWEAVRTHVRAVRERPARADRPRLPPPDPRRPAVEPAPAGRRRWASATASRRSSWRTSAPTRCSATSSRSRRRARSSATSRCSSSRPASTGTSWPPTRSASTSRRP